LRLGTRSVALGLGDEPDRQAQRDHDDDDGSPHLPSSLVAAVAKPPVTEALTTCSAFRSPMSPTVRGRADTSLSLPGSACQVLSGVSLRSLPVQPGLPMPPGGTHLLPGRVVAVDEAGAEDERHAEVALRGIEMHSSDHPKPSAVAAEEAGVQAHFRISREDGSIRCLPSLSISQGSLT